MPRIRDSSTLRGVLVLAVAMLAAGALAINPAVSAVDGLSKKEKKQGDKRWINVGEKASDADKLDGQDSSAFLGANAKAADADKLDGIDSAGFLENGATAGGDLSGTYPNPEIAGGAVGSAEIDDGSVTEAELAPRGALQTPTLLSCDGATNWTTNVALARPVRFWKDRSGVVHLQGGVSCSGNATEGGAIFNLPSGFRPAFIGGVVRWAALAAGGSTAQIAVLDSGNFAVVYDGPDNTTVDNYISLDGLTFRAEG